MSAYKHWPHWSKKYTSQRDFKEKKRVEVKAALSAIDTLTIASAFTPATKQISDARLLLTEARLLMSVNKWGR